MATYIPRPIDTSRVKLSSDLLELTETLAEHAHDTWAELRIQEGWTWGPKREDLTKTHPDLVPYGELSQSEKEYDRRAAMETLRAIIARGWEIKWS